MNYLQIAYSQGMNKAAQSVGYTSFEAFQKEAAGLLSSVQQVARQGRNIGAGIGVVGGGLMGMTSGPQDQSFGDRALRGLSGAAVGGAVGGVAGHNVGRLGQQAYRNQVSGFAKAQKAMGGNSAMINNVTQQYGNAPNFVNKAWQSAKQQMAAPIQTAKNMAWGAMPPVVRR